MFRRLPLALSLTCILAAGGAVSARSQADRGRLPPATTIQKYCVTCHNDRLKTAGLSLAGLDVEHPSANAETWEKVIRKLRTSAMPPPTAPRPDAATYNALASHLETSIDRDALASPRPGKLALVHRLSRTEYQNAVRDLLAHRHAAERDRLLAAAAARQLVERLRQHRRPAVHVAGDHGALSRRRGEDQPSGDWRSRRTGDGQPLSPERRAVAGLARRRAAVGHARRPRRQEPLPRRRRVSDPGPVRGAAGRAASARDHGRRRACAARHVGASARRGRGDPRQQRESDGTPRPAQQRTGEPDPDRPIEFRVPIKAGPAARRRHLHRARRGARRGHAPTAYARPRLRARALVRHDQRPVRREDSGRHAKPASHLHVPYRGRRRARRDSAGLDRRAYRRPVVEADIKDSAAVL